jgi:hypothetical protein
MYINKYEMLILHRTIIISSKVNDLQIYISLSIHTRNNTVVKYKAKVLRHNIMKKTSLTLILIG